MDDDERRWRSGELAAATGLTVRTLRHYDEIALLVPTERSSAGHRRYTPSDVRRLHLIVVLRGLGLPLAAIVNVLDGGDLDPVDVVRRHLEQVEQRITTQQRLRRILRGLLTTVDTATEPTTTALLGLIEEMTTMEYHLTPDQLRELTEGRSRMTERLSPEEFSQLGEKRRAKMAQLPADQRAAMARRRSAMMMAADDGEQRPAGTS